MTVSFTNEDILRNSRTDDTASRKYYASAAVVIKNNGEVINAQRRTNDGWPSDTHE